MPTPGNFSFNYSAPTSDCDVVMKGGITSGVVYPLAICELAQTFRFRSIGGTSAGAIAAAVTAAAEYGRQHRQGTCYKALETLPEWLGADGNLVGLFQPTGRAKPLFRLLMSSLGNGPDKWLRVARGLMLNFGWYAVGGALPALLLLPALRTLSGGAWFLTLVAALVLALTMSAVAVVVAIVRTGSRALN